MSDVSSELFSHILVWFLHRRWQWWDLWHHVCWDEQKQVSYVEIPDSFSPVTDYTACLTSLVLRSDSAVFSDVGMWCRWAGTRGSTFTQTPWQMSTYITCKIQTPTGPMIWYVFRFIMILKVHNQVTRWKLLHLEILCFCRNMVTKRTSCLLLSVPPTCWRRRDTTGRSSCGTWSRVTSSATCRLLFPVNMRTSHVR